MTQRITLQRLRVYQAIMMDGGISRAAERLHMTQPAVSRQLALLEEILGFRLFDRRSGGPMYPTRNGLQFYRALESALNRIEELPNIADDIASRSREWLRIAATPPLLNSQVMIGGLERFTALNPDTRLLLEPRNRLEIEEWVVNRHVDMGLALLPVENPMVRPVPLFHERVVVVIGEDHRLAGRNIVRSEDLAGERLILPTFQPLRNFIDPALKSAGISPDIVIETAALTCCRFASEGLGVAICDPFSPTVFNGRNLRTIPWEPEISLTYGAIFTHDSGQRPLAEAFMDSLRDSYDKSAVAMQ